MLTSHDTFKEVVAKAVRPNWKALAAEFATGGLTDADGKAPSGETKTDVVEGSQDSRCPDRHRPSTASDVGTVPSQRGFTKR
jgi:hypothetical protein